MSVIFAKPETIQGMLLSIINAAPVGDFSDRVAIDASADKRYSDEFVRTARRMAAARVLEAIGNNPQHPYWGYLATKVSVVNGDAIPPCFGQIGIPEIQPANGSSWIQGDEAASDEIDSYRGDSVDNAGLNLFSNPLGEARYSHLQKATSGVKNPISAKYSTTNGYITFTGYACRMPMLKVPDDGGRTLAGTVSTTSESNSVVGTLAFQLTDIGKRLIVTYDNTLVFTGIIQSLATTSIANDTAVTDTQSELTQAGASARTEDVYLAMDDTLDNKIPVELAATNVRLAIGLLVKEGDSLRQIAAAYAGQGEVDLIKITQGATAVNALDVTRAIQSFQRYKQ